MPVFIKTKLRGQLSYIGRVRSRQDDLKSSPLREAELTFLGIESEDHGGWTRPSCARVSMLYDKGTTIANARQISIMSDEELEIIKNEAGLSDNRPEWWGASLVLRGLPDLSALPPSSRLRFPSGAAVRVDVENGPCKFAADEVRAHAGGKASTIKSVAQNRRGVVGSVEREGRIALGDVVELFVPNARIYKPLESRRS